MKRQIHLTMEDNEYEIIMQKAITWFQNHNTLPVAIKDLNPENLIHLSQIRDAFLMFQANTYNTKSDANQLCEELGSLQNQISSLRDALVDKSKEFMDLEGENCELIGKEYRSRTMANEYDILLRVAHNIFCMIPRWLQFLSGLNVYISNFKTMFNNCNYFKV